MKRKIIWFSSFIGTLIFFNMLSIRNINSETFKFYNEQLFYPVYRLGISDKISLKVYRMESLDTVVKVLPDGTINLPRVGSIKVAGLTLDQTKQLLLSKYGEILKRPILYINLIETRPIKVTVVGEVQRPGIYSISVNDNSELSNADGGEGLNISFKGWPSVIEAIQKAGGLSNKADLRKITLVRDVNENSEKLRINYDFWDILRNGTAIKNDAIFDGDVIKVNKANENNEMFNRLLISKSNFSPSNITVNVIGEVINPGQKVVRSNSPLSEALLAAGGLTRKANKSKISLIRLSVDGSVKNQKYQFLPGEDVDKELNPPLLDRDTIVVKKNSFAKAVNKFEDITSPARSIIDAASLYKLLN